MSSAERANIRIWLYRRTAPGEFVPIAINTWNEWAQGKAKLAPSDDGFVWYVTLSVWILNRKVLEVAELQFSKSRSNAAGFREEKMKAAELLTAMNSVWERQDARPSPGPVVDAASRFAERQFRWKPTAADLRALHEAVNRRAGRRVLL